VKDEAPGLVLDVQALQALRSAEASLEGRTCVMTCTQGTCVFSEYGMAGDDRRQHPPTSERNAP